MNSKIQSWLKILIFKTNIRTAVQHNGKKLSTIQKSFPHGQWVDYDCDSMISGMKSKAGFQNGAQRFFKASSAPF